MTAAEYARDFTREVRPRLLPALNVAAHLFRLDVFSFDESASLVLQIALRLGASGLSEKAFCDLNEWIISRLVARFALPSPDGWLTRAQLERIRNDVNKLGGVQQHPSSQSVEGQHNAEQQVSVPAE